MSQWALNSNLKSSKLSLLYFKLSEGYLFYDVGTTNDYGRALAPYMREKKDEEVDFLLNFE